MKHTKKAAHGNLPSMKTRFLMAAVCMTFLVPAVIGQESPEPSGTAALREVPFNPFPDGNYKIVIACGVVTADPPCKMYAGSSCKLSLAFSPALPSTVHACYNESSITGFTCDPCLRTVIESYHSATPWCAVDSGSSTGCASGCADEQPDPSYEYFTYEDDDLWTEPLY